MTRIGREEKQQILAQLLKDAGEGDNVAQVVKDFVEHQPGARLMLSEGDGRVSLLIPVRDAYQGLDRIQFAPTGNLTNILYEVKRTKSPVTIDGIGRFHEFIFEPFDFRKKALQQAEGGDGPAEVALRGEGPGVQWSPLQNEDSWYRDGLEALALLAADGGVLVGGPPKDRGWKKLSEPALEPAQDRAAPQSPPLSADALGQGAIRGIEQLLEVRLVAQEEAPPAAVTTTPDAPEIDPADLGPAVAEWSLPALDGRYARLEVEPNRLLLRAADLPTITLERERLGSISSWQVRAPALGERVLYEADRGTIDALAEVLRRFSTDGAKHPLLSLLREERDQSEGGILADALSSVETLAARKGAQRSAELELSKAALRDKLARGTKKGAG